MAGAGLKSGDYVTVVKIPSGLRDSVDLKTRSVFRASLGKTYRVEGFDRYGHVQLDVTKLDSIWIEPEFVMPAKRKRRQK